MQTITTTYEYGFWMKNWNFQVQMKVVSCMWQMHTFVHKYRVFVIKKHRKLVRISYWFIVKALMCETLLNNIFDEEAHINNHQTKLKLCVFRDWFSKFLYILLHKQFFFVLFSVSKFLCLYTISKLVVE